MIAHACFSLKPTEEREFQINGRLSLDKVREIGHSVATPGLPFPSLKWVGNHVLKNAAISGFVNARKTSQVKVLEKEVSVVELEDIDKMKSTILSMIEGIYIGLFKLFEMTQITVKSNQIYLI